MPSGIGSRVATSTPVRGAILTACASTARGHLRAGHGEDDEVVARMVGRGDADLVDVDLRAAQGRGEAGGPGALADDGGAAQRRQPAEPLPLEHHVRPDAVGHGGRELRRDRVDLREGERPADPRANLLRADAPAPADGLGADQRDRDDRRAGLQREAADAALGAPERARPGAGALGEDQDAVAALEDRPRGLEHVRVAGAAAHREGAERADEPRDEPVLEDLALGDVVDRPAVEHADDERVQERPVVGGEDHRPGGRDVLAADAAEPEVQMEERLQDRARDPVDDRVDTALAGPLVQAVELPLGAVYLFAAAGISHVRAVPAGTLLVTVAWSGNRRHPHLQRRPGRCRRRRRVAPAAAARQVDLRLAA